MHIVVQVTIYSLISVLFCELIFFIYTTGRNDSDNANLNEVGNLTTSIVGMLPLLQLEKELMQHLEEYARELGEKEGIIRSILAQLQREHDKSALNAENYLSIPTNSLSMTRRMHEDWPRWMIYMQQPVGTAEIRALEAHLPELPKKADFEEAINALERIQSTYELKAIELATGLINGKQYDAQLRAHDCYRIGEELNRRAKYAESTQWFDAAMQLFTEEPLNVVMNFTRLEVETRYRNAKATKIAQVRLEPQVVRHNIGCRGEYPQEASPQLHCVYNTTTTPFLKLAPFKMEIIHLDPYMVLFHDVLSQREIAELQALTRNRLKRATVVGKNVQERRLSNMRTSKIARLKDDACETVARINRRIAHMTGFDVSNAEMLQMQNYGLGGHYNPHYDFFTNIAVMDPGNGGNRIATVLFYLNDVEQGGATIFPQLHTTIFPKQGTALLWYNLDNRGAEDYRMLHSACPVLVGSKWICTKWIREQDQMFRRPCYK